MKKLLVTGSTGFVGSHMIDYILSNYPEYEIIASKRRRSDMDNVKHVIGNSKVRFVDTNIEDAKSVDTIFENDIKFDKCFHLAAQSFVKQSWNSPAETLNTNIIGTLNLLESFRKFNPECVIQIAGSSEEYGLYNGIIDENVPLKPLSPYAVSKVAEENLAYQYHKSYGLKTITTRAFNHTGPKRGEVFVTSSFAKQIVEIEKSGNKDASILHGNLDSYRDFTDVRDVVRAYWLATEKCKFGEPYNIASNRVVKIDDVLNILLSYSNIKITKKLDESRMRPSDLTFLQGNNKKFCDLTGWSADIPLEKSLNDLLIYWREKI